jgi:hypothetical protein
MFHTTRINNAYRKVEKLPLPPAPSDKPESFSSTPRRAKDARSTKAGKFSSPVRVLRLQLGRGEHKPPHKTTPARHLEEEETRSRAIRTCRLDQPVVEYSCITSAKEQKSGPSGSRRRVRESEVEDDPDLQIAAV